MKTLFFFFIISFNSLLLAQQFTLEAIIETRIKGIFDIDGDGVCEYIADSNKVYDGATHQLKFTFPGTSLHWGEPEDGQNQYSYFPHIDYNSDGNREIIYYAGDYQDTKAYVYDLVNSQILFEFDPPEGSINLKDLIDIDGDGELELVFQTYTSPDINKNYVYSTGITTTVFERNNSELLNEYKLKQNFPNPFNPSTTIRYTITSTENVSIKIFDVSGQLVKEINKGHNQSGEYEIVWDGKNNFGERVSSGAYFYQLSVGNYNEAKKMILLK